MNRDSSLWQTSIAKAKVGIHYKMQMLLSGKLGEDMAQYRRA